jgi:mono/diheme cytochrome c family protein
MRTVIALASLGIFVGCSSSSRGGLTIAGQATAVAGDAIALEVVDGDGSPLGSDAQVTWSMPKTVLAISPDSSMPNDPLPSPGAAPTAVFMLNPTRDDIAATIRGVLFVLDAGSAANGTIDIVASVSTQTAALTATVAVSPGPTGDATRGQAVYTANCAICHGPNADGSVANPDGTFTIDGMPYMYPAPGLNNAPDSGNLGNDPAWNAALLAFAARSDADNGAVALRTPMPNWLAMATVGTSAPPTTQDFADIYAFLVGETQ